MAMLVGAACHHLRMDIAGVVTRPWEVKLRRAVVHMTDLQSRVEEHLAGRPFDVVAETRDNGRLVVVRMVGDTSIPEEWSAIVGDVLHNLRSALDCLVVGLAEANLGRSLTEEEEHRLQFPICLTDEAWDSALRGRRLRYVDPAVVEEIRKLQPFAVHGLAGSLGDTDQQSFAKNATLTRLSILSNTDKHRRVHLAAGHAAVHWVALSKDQLVTDLRLVEPPPWTDGSVICEWSVGDSDATRFFGVPPQVGGQLIVSFLSDIQSGSGQSVPSSLQAMYGAVTGAVWKLTPFLGSSGGQPPP